MHSVSLVMIVKNESKYLERCLRSAAPMVQEMVVVDTGSEDQTKDIALQLGAKVFDFEWTDDFAAARNYAISQAQSEWVMMLDADEYFPNDQTQILERFISSHTSGQTIGKINIVSRFMQDGAEQTVQAEVSRLFSRSLRFNGSIHEQLDSTLPRVSTGLELLHDGYFETNKSDRNIRLLLKELSKKPNEPYLLFQLGKEYKGIDEWDQAEELFERGYAKGNEENLNYVNEAVVDFLYILLHNKRYDRSLQIIQENVDKLQNLADFFFVGGLIFMDAAIANSKQAGAYLQQLETFYLRCISLGFEGGKEIVKGTSSFLPAYNLALYYEMTGNIAKAKDFYEYSSELGYEPATARLSMLDN